MLSTWLWGIVHSTSILATTPCTISFMHGGGVSSQIEAVQTMVDQMKTALEEAQAKLTVLLRVGPNVQCRPLEA